MNYEHQLKWEIPVYGCTNLVSAVIGTNVNSIGTYAFANCAALTNVSLPAALTSIADWAFSGCADLAAMSIPNCVSSIGNDVFFDCSQLVSFSFGSGVTNIGSYMFLSCSSLTHITIPTGITSIGADAFLESGLVSVTIAGSVTNIASDAFNSCTNRMRMYFQGNAPTADPSAFSGDKYPTVFYLPGTNGWSSFRAQVGLSAVLWNPRVRTVGSVAVQNHQFTFNIAGSANIPVEVGVTTNLARPIWTPLQTLTLTNGLVAFHDA